MLTDLRPCPTAVCVGGWGYVDLENSSLLFKGVLTYKCERTKLSVWEARETDSDAAQML